MAFPFRTGFEHGISPAAFVSQSGHPVSESVTTDNPRSGSRAMRISLASLDQWNPPEALDYTRANTTTAKVSLVASVYFSDMSGLNTQGFRMAVVADAATSDGFVFLQINKDGGVELRRVGSALTSGGNLIDSLPAGTIIAGSWYTFEILILPLNSGGEYDVAINGASVMSGTGVDTFDGIGAMTTTCGFQFRCIGEVSQSVVIDVDDVMFGVDETSLLTVTQGLPVHEALVPTSDIEADGTPSTGLDHYALVDEIPPGASDYVEFDTAGDRERFGFSNRTETGDVLGLMVWSTASDPLTADTIRTLINSNATEVESGNLVLSATPGTAYTQNQETDPDTGIAWTTAGVNAVTAGARRPV